MEDVVALVVKGAFWVACLGVGCLLGVWSQGKLSALWRAITNDRDAIDQLKVIVSTDRDRIEALIARVEELESKFVSATSETPDDWSKAEWIDMKDIYNSVYTDFLNENVVNLNENN